MRGGGGSVTASGATARLPPLGTTLTCWGGGVSGAPGLDGPGPGLERNGFSSASFDKSLSRAGVETMVEISGFSLSKTAANFSANSLADWKRLLMSRSSALSNQAVNASGRSGR